MSTSNGASYSYNTAVYGAAIKEQIPDIGKTDFNWIADQVTAFYKSIDNHAIENFRVCKGEIATSAYHLKLQSVHGQHWDKVIENRLTGNTFRIGFSLRQ